MRAWPAYRDSGRYRLSRHVYVQRQCIDGLVQLAAAAKAEAEAAAAHIPTAAIPRWVRRGRSGDGPYLFSVRGKSQLRLFPLK